MQFESINVGKGVSTEKTVSRLPAGKGKSLPPLKAP